MTAPYNFGFAYGRPMAAVVLENLDEGILGIRLNRPDKLNAIDGALMDGVDAALAQAESGDHRVAILTGAGRGFCAGADLSGTGQGWTTKAEDSAEDHL